MLMEMEKGQNQGFVPISHPNPKPDNIDRVLGYLTIPETHATKDQVIGISIANRTYLGSVIGSAPKKR